MAIIALRNSPSGNCHLWLKPRQKRERPGHKLGKSHAPRERRRRKPARRRESKATLAGMTQANLLGIAEGRMTSSTQLLHNALHSDFASSSRAWRDQTGSPRLTSSKGESVCSRAGPTLSGGVSELCVWFGPVTTPDREPSVGESVSLFREPDAGKLPVRFDEREQETGPGQTGLR